MIKEEQIVDFAVLAEVGAAALRVTILDAPDRSGIDRAEPYVRRRCAECADVLDFCADRLRALEDFVTDLTEVKAITDTPEFGEILDKLMTSMEEESAEFRSRRSKKVEEPE